VTVCGAPSPAKFRSKTIAHAHSLTIEAHCDASRLTAAPQTKIDAPRSNWEEVMSDFQIRRVVTGHDANGKAVVLYDEIGKEVSVGRPGATSCVVWTTEGWPISNDGSEDEAKRKSGTTLENGTVFRIVRFDPGVTPRNHRTDSIDYAVVMSGEIDMDLDGTVVHLKAGDILVQRGTVHNWINRGKEPCVIAFSLIYAKPVTTKSGKKLDAHG
jgi:quercetin dioxygenase-like cupin family protein